MTYRQIVVRAALVGCSALIAFAPARRGEAASTDQLCRKAIARLGVKIQRVKNGEGCSSNECWGMMACPDWFTTTCMCNERGCYPAAGICNEGTCFDGTAGVDCSAG